MWQGFKWTASEIRVKDKRNKRHVGCIRPAFDRFPGRITASYMRFMSTSQRELPRSADFFRGGRRISETNGMSVVSGRRLTGFLAGLRRRICVLCQPRSENCPGLPIFFGEAGKPTSVGRFIVRKRNGRKIPKVRAHASSLGRIRDHGRSRMTMMQWRPFYVALELDPDDTDTSK